MCVHNGKRAVVGKCRIVSRRARAGRVTREKKRLGEGKDREKGRRQKKEDRDREVKRSWRKIEKAYNGGAYTPGGNW